jgi:hypothetical protein
VCSGSWAVYLVVRQSTVCGSAAKLSALSDRTEQMPQPSHVMSQDSFNQRRRVEPIMEKHLVNPKIKVMPLRLPPRNEYDDVDCERDLKIEG